MRLLHGGVMQTTLVIRSLPPTPGKMGATNLRNSDFAKKLRSEVGGAVASNSSQVKARIHLYIHKFNAENHGDLDNYAKNILDLLKKPNANNAHGGILVDDSQVWSLHISRHPCKVEDERVEIALTWKEEAA